MIYTEILELIRAGYKKEEIEAMMAAESKQNQEPKQEQKQEPKADPEPEPDRDPEPPAKSETDKLVEALGMKLDSLTNAIQAKNVNQIEGGAAAETPDDILAKIINPHFGEV